MVGLDAMAMEMFSVHTTARLAIAAIAHTHKVSEEELMEAFVKVFEDELTELKGEQNV